ncbi:hypothetical protein IQ260_11925 [Leptolyngbya cf. ectocarpi LEGE 11479]|uniref:Uncharacterized protein n=1 Tax=Leptolyngbya cf. ectocarpi LEGE 11479 TaxID=1828722 RepID=A0A928ZTV9_LEPEC|nr:hypothetical protein [Leptolyngbya ectocarpi]MBE9067364.1 hypothetical protein [Leptolyngbya cf. ectocarpi LEGE 11479]
MNNEVFMLMELCPCCGVQLLRHVSKSGSYWRCGSCRFEMPETLQVAPTETSKATESLLDEIDPAETVTAS